MARGARVVVYFALNTDQGFLDGLTSAIHDKQYKPSVIFINWGGPECTWTSQAMNAFDAAARDAALLGIAICSSETGRGVPDIGGSADLQTGYEVLVEGHTTVIGGTSLVAPLWASRWTSCNRTLCAGWLHRRLPRHHRRPERNLCRSTRLGRRFGLRFPSGENLLKAL